MDSANAYMFMITALGAIYMLQHGLLNSKIIETATGMGFALISLAVFFGTNMHVTTMLTINRWMS